MQQLVVLLATGLCRPSSRASVFSSLNIIRNAAPCLSTKYFFTVSPAAFPEIIFIESEPGGMDMFLYVKF